jgi:microcystin-dependent protein
MNVAGNSDRGPAVNSSTSGVYEKMTFDASRSSSIYSDSVNTVQPPAVTLIPQIRYKKDTIINDGTPVGTVISFFGLTAPTGYLSCDGTVYNIADYSALADHINTQFGSYNYFGGDGTTTFAVPDLRGEFLRGTGTNSHTGQGSGSNVGTHQDGTEHIKFYRTLEGTSYFLSYSNQTIGAASDRNADSTSTSISGNAWAQPGGSNTTSRSQYYTSRPTNTSVLYCIKF